MAESLVFKIYPRASYETPFNSIEWYQSDDGINWDLAPVDSILISSLTVSGDNYTWDSLLASADRYHLLRFIDSDNITTSTQLSIQPKSFIYNAAMSGVSLSVNTLYSPGDEIELLFRLNDSAIPQIGDQIRVELVDEYGSVIDTVYADRIGSLYHASWNIPLNINEYLLSINHPGINEKFFTIYDRWNLIGGAISFGFNITRHIDTPTEENCIIHLSFKNIVDEENISIQDTALLFTTSITPYYASIHDVRSIHKDLLEVYDDFTILKTIVSMGNVVDFHMKPDNIVNQNAYDLAVSKYVALTSAIYLLISKAQDNLEEKQLDSFRYKRQSATPEALLNPLNAQARKYALIIWAGGLDTPFVSKIFEKGLYDPNRPDLVRGDFDANGWFPYLNAKSSSYVANINGENVEIRGERLVAYRYINNRYNGLLSVDNGDVGYLARI